MHRNISAGAAASRLSYLTEGYISANPGLTGWVKNMGTIAYSTGTATGINITFSSSVTGNITIYVKSKY